MFRPAFGVIERILLRPFCSHGAAAGSRSKPAGARMLHQHSRSNAGSAGRNFGFFRRNHKSQAMAIVAFSTSVGVGLGYMSRNLLSPEVEACVISKNLLSSEIEKLHPSEIDSVEDGEKLHPSEIDSVEAGEKLHPSEIDSVEATEKFHPSEIDSVEAHDSLRPSEIDWVEAGVVSPVVRKQNGCDCCWAVAAVASVESLHYLNTKQSIALSVQELIDCDTGNNGCESGYCRLAMKYIMKNGISSESSYPYIAQTSAHGCDKLDKEVAARISDFMFVDPTEDALEEAVAQQPVIVRLHYVDDMWNYEGGIMEYQALPDDDDEDVPAHFVLIVGYGIMDDGVKYWRFKNSWGEDWGEGGFGRIRRHVADERGLRYFHGRCLLSGA